MHKHKIDMKNEIYVIDVGGDIGESTRNEIRHSKSKGILVKYLKEYYGPTEDRENAATHEDDVGQHKLYGRRAWGQARHIV